MLSMKVSEKLQALCKARRWKQKDLLVASGAEITKTTMSNYFKGKHEPDMKAGPAIARALGVSMEWLADDSADFPSVPAALTENERMALSLYREARDRLGDVEALAPLYALRSVKAPAPSETAPPPGRQKTRWIEGDPSASEKGRA